jgi:hypothetical protein
MTFYQPSETKRNRKIRTFPPNYPQCTAVAGFTSIADFIPRMTRRTIRSRQPIDDFETRSRLCFVVPDPKPGGLGKCGGEATWDIYRNIAKYKCKKWDIPVIPFGTLVALDPGWQAKTGELQAGAVGQEGGIRQSGTARSISGGSPVAGDSRWC